MDNLRATNLANVRLIRAAVLLAMPPRFTTSQLSEKLSGTGGMFGSIAALVYDMHNSGLLKRRRLNTDSQTGRPPKGLSGVRRYNKLGWTTKQEAARDDELNRADGKPIRGIQYEYMLSDKGRQMADMAWHLLVALDLVENCEYRPVEYREAI